MGINGRISQTERVSYSLLHCLYMQMSCSCQKSRKQEDTEREREGRKESGRHGSNLIDQLRIR